MRAAGMMHANTHRHMICNLHIGWVQHVAERASCDNEECNAVLMDS